MCILRTIVVFLVTFLPLNTVQNAVLPIQGENATNPYDYSQFSHHSPHIRHRERKKPKDENFLEKSPFDMNLKYCQRPANCQVLNYTTCMGAKLPYHSTTLQLTDLSSQDKVQEKLQLYQYLRFIPKCWAVIQPFLCALYMPKCDKGKVDLPSREMCRITLKPCQIIYNSSVFPEFFNCEDERLFPTHCKNDIHEMKFNTTGYCLDPLIKTDKPEWWHPDVEGCGLKCKDSLYTENEHYQIHKLITYCVLLCIILNLFTITTFIIDWRTANKYPAKAIFYVNICFCISYGGWLVQFLGSETREDVVCKKDGTLRKSEPSATENLSCVVVFFMVYYFLIAGMVWFVIFSYAWHMSSLQALGKIQERVDKKRAYFHLVAWSLPLILTITTMAIGEIDGDYVTGICFVGFMSMAARSGLLLAPLAATMFVSGYIIVRGLILLIKVKIDSKDVISQHSSRKIQSNIVRMGVFGVFMVVFCVITFGYHNYVAMNRGHWDSSLQNFILCKLTSFSTDYSHCKQTERPSVAMLQLQLLAVFGSGIAMASWVWCDATLRAWGRYIRKKFHCEIEEPMKIQKHKIIAKSFAKRKKFYEGEQISIFSQNHTDPVGLQFELNSAASNELSTTWQKYLARLVNRRNAVPNEAAYSISSNNQSIDSEVSLNVRHVSIESRRNSGDSQLSVQIAELKATRKVNSRRHRRHNKHHFRSNSRNIGGHSSRRPSRSNPKRDSSTSLDSHLQILNAITSNTDVKRFGPNLNRRTANAGLDGSHIGNLLTNGKLVIPRSMRSGSEDENVSVTISESTINMRVNNLDFETLDLNDRLVNMSVKNQNNMDLNDELVMKSLRRGLHIEEIDDSSEDTDSIMKKDYGQEKKFGCKSGRDSHSSRRSKRSSKRSRKKYSSNSDSCEEPPENKTRRTSEDSSSCPEIKQLVQSSLNSTVSVGFEKNRGSRQSKTSMDVAVQANAHDLDLEMQNKKNLVEDSCGKAVKRSQRAALVEQKKKSGRSAMEREEVEDKRCGRTACPNSEEDENVEENKRITKKKYEEKQLKTKQAKTKENKKYRRASKYSDEGKNCENVREKYKKYKSLGTSQELKFLNRSRDSNKHLRYSDAELSFSEDEDDRLIVNRNKVSMTKSSTNK